MTYDDSLDYLKLIENSNHTPSHQNSVTLMAYLDNIQDTLSVIHVAGTNGKGSTINFIRDVLIEANYSVGTFMSPHIFDFRELIEDNHAQIRDEDFCSALSVVKDACNRMVKDGHNHPTVFEILVAISILHFSNKHHDFVLIEVGLGGREDATNVFKQPLMSIITPISYDHEALLGQTLSEIASHKAGIIKAGTPILLAPNPIEVISVITEEVKRMDTHLYLLDEGLMHSHTFVNNPSGKIFNLKTPFFDYKNLHTVMLGRHQEINIATALLALTKLRGDYNIPDKAIYAGIKKTTWTCRNEIICIDPPILIDGGHNPAGLRALKSLIDDYYKTKHIVTVIGILKDKSYINMLDIAHSFSDKVVITEPMSDRALTEDMIPLSDYVGTVFIKDNEDALKHALSLMTKETVLVVTGSLYLTYPAKVWLLDHIGK